jgi:hypothetical protein
MSGLYRRLQQVLEAFNPLMEVTALDPKQTDRRANAQPICRVGTWREE